MKLVPTASDNERIRSIINECWIKDMSFADAVAILAAAGFGAREIIEFQIWAKANPSEIPEKSIEHDTPHDNSVPFKEY